MTLPRRLSGRTLIAAVLTVMLAIAGLLTGAGSAVAAPAPVSTAPRVTFGVQPGVRNAPDSSRADFSYSATPGARMNDFIAIRNYATKPVTLQTYARDAFNDASGAYSVLRRGQKSADLGAWITLDKSSVTVPARGFVIVPFHISLPANATPGDHDAGILAGIVTQKVQANGKQVSVEDRVGARMHIRISGALHPQLLVRKLKTSYHGSLSPFDSGSATVTYEIANTGNVRFSATQELQLHSMLGGSASVPKLAAIPELLPGNSIQQQVKVSGVWPGIRLSATVVLVPAPSSQFPIPTLAPIRTSHSSWAMPWTLILLILVLAAAAAWYLRRRRRMAAEAARVAAEKRKKQTQRRRALVGAAAPAGGAGAAELDSISDAESASILDSDPVSSDGEADSEPPDSVDLRDNPPMKVDLRNPFAGQAIDLRGASKSAHPDTGNPGPSTPTEK